SKVPATTPAASACRYALRYPARTVSRKKVSGTHAIASAFGNARAPVGAASPSCDTSALTMRTVALQATFVVQIVLTAASKTVGVRSILPAPAAAHESAGSSATSA